MPFNIKFIYLLIVYVASLCIYSRMECIASLCIFNSTLYTTTYMHHNSLKHITLNNNVYILLIELRLFLALTPSF